MRLLDIMTSPWAIVPEKLREIRAIYETHMRGEKIDFKALKQKAANLAPADPDGQPVPAYQVDRGVAIIAVEGVLTKNRTFFSYIFGGASMRDIGDAIRTALADTRVHSILLHVDSPGGTVDGTEELAGMVNAARGVKPIVAVADGMMASAAYWIAAAANKIYIVGETTQIGSIGVVGTHVDVSEQDRMLGEKWTEITAGKYKRIASMHRPLTEDGRAYLQAQIDTIYGVFVNSVADYRNRSVEQVIEAADGRIFMGQEAVQVGLADGMAAVDEIIQTLKEEWDMDLNELKTKHADLYQVVISEGRTAGLADGQEQGRTAGYDQGKAVGMKDGAEAERARIQGIEAVSLAGHEDLVARMKFDGVSTAADVSLAIITEEKKTRDATVQALLADGKVIVPAAVAPAVDPPPTADADPNLPVDQRSKAAWDKDPAIRAEFSNNFDNYLAWMKSTEAGRARILGRK